MGFAASIMTKLGIDTADLRTGLNKAQRDVDGFAKNFKRATSGLSNAFGGTVIAAAIRNTINSFKEMVPAVEQTDEALRSMRRNLAGLTEEQAKELAESAVNYEAFGDRAKGYFGKLVLGIKSVVSGGGIAGLKAPFQQKEETQQLKLSQEEQANLLKREASIAKKAREEKTRDELAFFDTIQKREADRVKAFEDEKNASLERLQERELERIDELRDAELKGMERLQEREERRVDEFRQNQQDTFEAMQEREVERVGAFQAKRQAKIEEKLKGPDQRREEKRAAVEEARIGREIDKAAAGAERTRQLNALQLPGRNKVGEVQGPQRPAAQPATSEDIRGVIDAIKNVKGWVNV